MAKKTTWADFVVRDASVLATPRGEAPLLGGDTRALRVIEGGWVASRRGEIVFVGDALDFREQVRTTKSCVEIDAKGRTVLPGLVDCHTHLVYAGDRSAEFARRLAGETYEEIFAEGGGILTTVKATRAADPEDLRRSSRSRLDRMLLHGTTTAEAKSGYGLTTEDEIKILEATRALDKSHPVDLVPTFLGAHFLPAEYKDRREAFLDLVCEEMIPAVTDAGLAEYCDIFCEEGVFSVQESRKVLTAAAEAGLGLRVHADELAASGGARLAAELGAATADHLVHVSAEAIEAMAEAGTAAVMLPATTFFLGKSRFAPALRLLDAGVPLALATDCNPGSSNTESLPMAMVIACIRMGFSVEQAISAATLNAAWSMGRHEKVGSLEPGKRMDLVVFDAPSHHHLVYHFGVNLVHTVVKDGKVVVEDGRLTA
jgi:imidazolonepropionase